MVYPDSLLTLSEVAAHLGVSRATVARYVSRGSLDAVRLGDADTSPIRVPGRALARFLAEAHERQVERRSAA